MEESCTSPVLLFKTVPFVSRLTGFPGKSHSIAYLSVKMLLVLSAGSHDEPKTSDCTGEPGTAVAVVHLMEERMAHPFFE